MCKVQSKDAWSRQQFCNPERSLGSVSCDSRSEEKDILSGNGFGSVSLFLRLILRFSSLLSKLTAGRLVRRTNRLVSRSSSLVTISLSQFAIQDARALSMVSSPSTWLKDVYTVNFRIFKAAKAISTLSKHQPGFQDNGVISGIYLASTTISGIIVVSSNGTIHVRDCWWLINDSCSV